MDEAQAGGVQTHAPEWIAVAAMPGVAEHRVTEIRELDADLVAAAGPEPQLHQGRVPPPLSHPVVRHRLPALRGGADAEGAVLGDAALRHALVGRDAALDAGDVHALHAPRLELRLQLALRARRLRDDEEAGGLAVEAVDDEGPARRPARFEIVPEEPVRRALS